MERFGRRAIGVINTPSFYSITPLYSIVVALIFASPDIRPDHSRYHVNNETPRQSDVPATFNDDAVAYISHGPIRIHRHI